MDRGSYFQHDGRPAVRFERTYPHPIERLWAAVTESEELAHWFPSAVRIEPRAGGTIEFSGDPNLEPSSGTVLAFEPPRRFAFTWGGDELHFELEPAGEGSCTLTLINVLESQDTAARNAAGWTVCLAEFDKHVSGETAVGPHGDSAEPWRPLYEEYVAQGMPSGAPIPGAPEDGS
ncbi:SRPBCC family protein [Streptomyces albidus (ex Kaewkla and Franco 2022)]|uniref:SRPBCC family protein n=1 Tax=Streptomyces albidus (ex Kaewkla and Franco 2022) TaxID=722709 RepID=UPI0015EF740F|nr:SRPBCC family protein [Streptomyces albidus (ex Kaewkla and Franco 2022)]